MWNAAAKAEYLQRSRAERFKRTLKFLFRIVLLELLRPFRKKISQAEVKRILAKRRGCTEDELMALLDVEAKKQERNT